MSWRWASLAVVLAALCGCPANPVAPPTRHILELHGTPYERGLQHGQALADPIREFYTQLLTASLLPYLGRQQPGIAAFLPVYAGPDYQDGKFSYQLLLDSARLMERSIPQAYRDEMQGVADGSGLTYEQVLILNTFADSTEAIRAISWALQLSPAPHIESVQFLGAADDDADNDSDGQLDEADEDLLTPYAALPTASAVELPVDVRIRFVLVDPVGIDPATVRVTLGDSVFTHADAALAIDPLPDDPTRLQVTLTPAAPLPPASVQQISIVAGDTTIVTDPPPEHARFMRQEWLAFSTRGLGKATYEIPNRAADSTLRPSSIAFAVRGSASRDGQPLLAQHFALLDANTSHNHTAIFIHHPESGPAFAVVGWAGIIWGFSGMNALGQSYACQFSDTLDNGAVKTLLNGIGDLSHARLVVGGTPIGIAGRELLEKAGTNAEALTALGANDYAYGYECLLADGQSDLQAVELDTNIDAASLTGLSSFDPQTLDSHGQPLASLGPDDLRLSANFLFNLPDVFTLTVQGERVVPQSQWSGTYFRSLRTQAALGEAMQGALGTMDVDAAEKILARPELVDSADSMNAVVYEPATRTLHAAIGTEPATDAPFVTVSLTDGGAP